MKKIAFVITSTGWGGLELNTLKLARQFEKMGYSILFITREETKLNEEATKNFANTTSLKSPKKYFDFKNAFKLARILKKETIDTAIIISNRDIDLLSITKRFFLKDLKIIYQQQMQVGIDKKDFLHTLRYKALQYWVCPLPYLKKEVLEKTKFPQERIKIIPLGIDIENFITKKYSQDEALKKLDINTTAPLIGILGRIDRKKGQDFLVKSIRELRHRNIDIELLIVGSPTINDTDGQQYFSEIKKMIVDEKLEKIVHVREHNSDVHLFYNAIDIFALASYSETFGMVTVEAMAAGVPVIASNKGGSPEILGKGKFGLLYELENINSFCEKVEWILNNPAKAQDLAALAQHEAINNYSEITIAKKISELIT